MSDQTSEMHMSTADLAAAAAPMPQGAASRPGDGAPQRAEQPALPMPRGGPDGRPTPLLASDEGDDMRERWNAVQIGFVDDPRHAAEMADSLVAELMQRLAQVFANQRSQLEGQWSRGEDVSTEDLRLALRQYRSFFDRLLSI